MRDGAQFLRQIAAGALDVALALLPLLADERLDLAVLARVQGREGEVLQLPLDRVDAEPMRERSEDVERLLRLVDLLLLRQRLQRAHVVEAVGQLDQDHPDVGGHRDHHLPVVLGLLLVAAVERDPGQLGDAVHELGDVVTEALAHVVERRGRVLDRVVEQAGTDRLRVEAHARADLRHADRVGDELLARAAALVRVTLAGERRMRPRPARGPRAGRRRRSAPRRRRTGPRAAPARGAGGPRRSPPRLAAVGAVLSGSRRPTRTCAPGGSVPAAASASRIGSPERGGAPLSAPAPVVAATRPWPSLPRCLGCQRLQKSVPLFSRPRACAEGLRTLQIGAPAIRDRASEGTA